MSNNSNKTKIEILNESNFIPKIPRNDSPKWREPVDILIKTRDDLINYAYTTQGFYDEDDLRSFMPVNSITEPSALFSEDEYMTEEAQLIIQKLEEKQTYTFEKYLKLMDYLKFDNNELLSAIDVIDNYYAWGISGLRAVICRKNKIELTTPLVPSSDESDKFVFKKYDCTFVNKDMELYEAMPPNWYCINTKEEIKSFLNEIKDTREWCIIPICQNIRAECIEYFFEKLKFKIAPNSYLAEFNGYESFHNTIKVLSPNITFLPHKYWALDSKEIKDNLFRHIQIETIINYIINKITSVSNASSYRMYRLLSLSPQAAVSTILHRRKQALLNDNFTEKPETLKYIEKSGIEALNEINILKYELPNLDVNFSSLCDSVSEGPLSIICNKIIDGEMNIDNILEGIRLDIITKDNGLLDFITAAVMKLDYSFDELIEEASKIEPNSSMSYNFMLEKKGIRIKFPLCRRNSRLIGHNLDLLENQFWMAKEGLNWCIVTDVYTEPGNKFARHVAVRMKTWPHHQYNKREGKDVTYVEDFIKEKLMAYCSSTESLYFDIANVIYNIYKGNYSKEGNEIKIDLKVGLKKKKITIYLNESIIKIILYTLEEKFEGTLEISDFIFLNGEPCFFILNAFITPYWVCPLHGDVFETSSLFLAWKYGKNDKNKTYYNKCINNGWLSKIQRNSLCYSLNPKNDEVGRLVIGRPDTDWDIKQYCLRLTSYDENDELKFKGILEHPWDIKYPGFKDFEINQDLLSEVYLDKNTRTKSKLKTVKLDDVWRNDPTMDIHYTLFAPRDIEASFKNINLFYGIQAEEMSEIRNSEQFLDIFKRPIGKLHVLNYKKDKILFEDGKWYEVNNISNLNERKYAIRKISSNIYYAYFKSGILRIELLK